MQSIRICFAETPLMKYDKFYFGYSNSAQDWLKLDRYNYWWSKYNVCLVVPSQPKADFSSTITATNEVSTYLSFIVPTQQEAGLSSTIITMLILTYPNSGPNKRRQTYPSDIEDFVSIQKNRINSLQQNTKSGSLFLYEHTHTIYTHTYTYNTHTTHTH